MKRYLSSIIAVGAALVAAVPLAGYAGSTNASAKVTIQTSALNVLGPFTASTATPTNISSGWQTVLEQEIKTANNWDLLLTASFEVGLLTQTTVSSKNMIQDTSTATASIKVKALVDGVESPPGVVVFGKRTQQLTATLEGAIANCLSVITNSAGGLQIVLNTNCVTAETIGLLEDTVAANSFVFFAPGMTSGFHHVQILAEIDAMGDNQNGSFTATGLMGKGTLSIEAARLVKDPVYPYVINF